jgi:hypothetical protein
MVERLREKPGGESLSVEIGDFVDVAVRDRYPLIFVIWNSFFNVLSQDEQIRCFKNVAAHLTETGSFVLEAFNPSFLHRLHDHQQVAAESVEVDRVRLGVLLHNSAEQTLEQSHVTIAETGIRLDPVAQRYAWPNELDLMARLAGLELKNRWSNWRREPFGSNSESHVSVYGR